jgi:hypothetical protein
MSENENEEMMQEEGPEQESSAPAHSTFYPGGYPEVEPGQPMTLDSLQDPPPGTKPRYPYSTLIRYASLSLSSRSRAPGFPRITHAAVGMRSKDHRTASYSLRIFTLHSVRLRC